MGKRKTLLTVILGIVLACLICVAAVLGAALGRSAFSDETEAEAGEARWKVTEKTVGEIGETETVTVPMEKLRPDYQSYKASTSGNSYDVPYDGPGWDSSNSGSVSTDSVPGIQTDEMIVAGTVAKPRTREFFGVVAVLQNAGEVKASVSVKDEGTVTFDKDGCGINDDRYSYEETAAHFECELWWSKTGTYASKDAVEAGEDVVTDESPLTLEADGEDAIYFYAHVIWTTDLDRDMYVSEEGEYTKDADGNKVVDEKYDGVLGDEFDAWAGEHLLGITFSVNIRAEQAE